MKKCHWLLYRALISSTQNPNLDKWILVVTFGQQTWKTVCMVSLWLLAVCCAMNLQDGGQSGRWVLSVPAGCYADCQGNYISGCLVSMVAPSETVAKQFWHLSNRSTVTATTEPPAEGQQEERQHKADSRQRTLSAHAVAQPFPSAT